MSVELLEKPKTALPGSGLGGAWRIIVLNDHHNSLQGVAALLARVIPGVSLADGVSLAGQIHRQGQAIVWSGHKELAEMYWEMLSSAGLTMAPLERS